MEGIQDRKMVFPPLRTAMICTWDYLAAVPEAPESNICTVT
jgi:hypothetical protein